MKKLCGSAILAGAIALGSGMMVVSQGDAPINTRQWMTLAGATLVAVCKDIQAVLMPQPSERA
jgi:hypothetical protein